MRDDERVALLVQAEVDVIVVDTAHGHSQNVIDAVKRYKKAHGDKVDVIAGNIATEEAAKELLDAGADAFLTGEASERTAHVARENGLHFFAAGHHATERYGVQALGAHLAQRFALKFAFVDIDNPI